MSDQIPVNVDDLHLTEHQQALQQAYNGWRAPAGKREMRPGMMVGQAAKADTPEPVYTNSMTTMPSDVAPELSRHDRRYLARVRRQAGRKK